MSIAEKWNISFSGDSLVDCVDKLKENSVREYLLNSDIRKLSISCPLIPANMQRIQTNQNVFIEGPIFLQILKVVDVSQPTRRGVDGEELLQQGPKGLLSISLTDGLNKFDLIDLNDSQGLSVKQTAPGTKLLLIGRFKIVNGLLFPTDSAKLQVLGGRVEKMYETWQANNSVKDKRALQLGPIPEKAADSTDAPPKFISFVSKGINLKTTKAEVKQRANESAAAYTSKESIPSSKSKQPPVLQSRESTEPADLEKAAIFSKHKLSSETFSTRKERGRGRGRREGRFAGADLERQYEAGNRPEKFELGSFIKIDNQRDQQLAEFLKATAGVPDTAIQSRVEQPSHTSRPLDQARRHEPRVPHRGPRSHARATTSNGRQEDQETNNDRQARSDDGNPRRPSSHRSFARSRNQA